MLKLVRKNYFYLLFLAFILIYEVSSNLDNNLIIITTILLLLFILLLQYVDENDEYVYHLIFIVFLGYLSFFSKYNFLNFQFLVVVMLCFQSNFYILKLLFVLGIYIYDLLYLKIGIYSEFSFVFILLVLLALTIRYILLKMYEKIDELSITDDLTGLLNQKGFFRKIEEEYYRSVRYGKHFTLIMLDADNLKRINDTYGHKYGTRTILFITEEIKKNIRRTDFACRYGGDEFLICLVETTAKDGLALAERLKETIAIKPLFTDKNQSFNVTVSMGIVGYPESSDKLYKLLDMVDKAMYQAKEKGKNQVCFLIKK